MAKSTTSSARVATREKEAQALELRKAGASLEVIASRVGYRDSSGARKAIVRAMGRLGEEDREEMRLLMTEQLRDLYRRTMDVLVRPHPLIQGGKVVYQAGPDGSQVAVEDDGVRLQAVAVLLRVHERTAKLLGLDAPTVVEGTGEGGAIPIEVVAAEVTDKLREWQTKRAAAGAVALAVVPDEEGR